MTVLNVRHITSYAYRRPVGFGAHRILFRPRDSHDQRLLSAEIAITPEPDSLRWIHDVFGNCVAIATFEKKAKELVFESSIALDHTPDSVPDFQMEARAKRYPFAYDDEEMLDLAPVIRRHFPDSNGEIELWARQFVNAHGSTDTGHVLMTMTHAISEGFEYLRRTDPGTQAPSVTLETRAGTCRDFALLMMEGVRALGLAARFVTGYIYVPSRDGSTTRGGGSTHAWCQVYLPGAGWVEFDPTNAIVGSRDLIRVGVGREPRQVMPLSGTYVGKRDDPLGMSVQVNVTRAEADAAPVAHPLPEVAR